MPTSGSARRSPRSTSASATLERHAAWRCYAQNMHQEETGAFTGEVSAAMLTELGVDGVVLGHSERRQYYGETDRALQEKVPAALDGRAPADPLRGRDRGGARARRDRAQAAPPGAGGAREGAGRAAGRGGDRLRADLGDRHRQGRHAGACPGGDRVRPRARGRPLRGGRRAHAGPLRRQREARQRGRDPRPAGRRRRARGRREPRPGGLRARSWPPRRREPVRRRASASSSWTAGGSPSPGPATRSSWPTRRCSTSSGQSYPHTTLTACGRAVGLPEGQMGNSEVGPPQPRRRRGGEAGPARASTRRSRTARSSRTRRCSAACDARARLHLLGPRLGRRRALEHGPPAGADRAGRGARACPTWCCTRSPTAATRAPTPAPAIVAEVGVAGEAARIATVSGRYYAMDRDKRWDRTKLAYDAIVQGRGRVPRRDRARRRCAQAYERGETDEFIKPTLVGEEGRIRDGDARDLLQLPPRPRAPARRSQKLGEFDAACRARRTLTEYQEDWDYPVAFPPARPDVTLASTLAERGERAAARGRDREVRARDLLLQRRRGGPVPGRGALAGGLAARRADLRQEARDERARGGARRSSERWRDGDYGFGIINFANPDMVGHTGVIEAAVKAIETVDECLGEVVEAVQESGGACVDHRRPRQRRPHARARRQPEHRPLDEPGAADRDRRRGRAARGRHRWPTWRRRCWPCWARSSRPR